VDSYHVRHTKFENATSRSDLSRQRREQVIRASPLGGRRYSNTTPSSSGSASRTESIVGAGDGGGVLLVADAAGAWLRRVRMLVMRL